MSIGCSRPRLAVTATAMVLLASVPPLTQPATPASAAPWRWPVPARLGERFHLAADHFARGQHRGIDLLAPPGASVRAVCPGRVTFAGRVASSGEVVSLACGRMIASYVGLGAVDVRAGMPLRDGAVLGRVGADGSLHLGARRAGRVRSYVDPLALLGVPGALRPLPPPRSVPGARPGGWGSRPKGLGPAPAPATAAPAPSARDLSRAPVADRAGELHRAGSPQGAEAVRGVRGPALGQGEARVRDRAGPWLGLGGALAGLAVLVGLVRRLLGLVGRAPRLGCSQRKAKRRRRGGPVLERLG